MAQKTVINALKKLLSCEYVDGSSNAHAILEEKDPQAKLKKLTLSHIGPGMLLLHVDAGRKFQYNCGQQKKEATIGMSPLFVTDGSHDCHRGCDAVLIRELDDQRCEIYYIELKSDDPSEFAGQFRSTRCFMRYLEALLEEFWQIKNMITKEQFMVFHTDTKNAKPSLGKQRTRLSPKSANRPEVPEFYIVRNSETVRCTVMF